MEVGTCSSLWDNKHIADNIAFMGIHNSDLGAHICAKLQVGNNLLFVQDNMAVGGGAPEKLCKHCRRLSEDLSAWQVFRAQKSTIILYQRDYQIYRVFPNGFAIPNCDNYERQQRHFGVVVKKLADLTAASKLEKPLATYKTYKKKSWCTRDELEGRGFEADTQADCMNNCTVTPGCTAAVSVMRSWDTKFSCSLKSSDPEFIKDELVDNGPSTVHIRDFETVPYISTEKKFDVIATNEQFVWNMAAKFQVQVAVFCMVAIILSIYLRLRTVQPVEVLDAAPLMPL